MALHNIIECNKKVALAEGETQQINANPPAQSNGLIFTEDEVIAAARYELNSQGADKKLKQEQENRQKAEEYFRNTLPKSVLNDMEKNGRAVHAYFVNQDVYAHRYGPFAAYFKNGKLTVEKFDNYQDFEERFKRMRDQ